MNETREPSLTEIGKPPGASGGNGRIWYALTAGLAVALLWAYWPTLRSLADRWSKDPRYSHGYLVPVFSAFVIWWNWGESQRSRGKASWWDRRISAWWGVALVFAGMTLWLSGTYLYFEWFSEISILPTLAGFALVAGGLPLFRKCLPGIVFLFFMVPLPYRIETALGSSLQRFATLAGTFVLQTCGLQALSEGNLIVLENKTIGIVEACNGLGMLMMFFAFSSAAALLIERPMLDKVLIVLSAVPIAIIANVCRITATAILYEMAKDKTAEIVFHDLAGWLMMPLALGILWCELTLLSYLFVEVDDTPANYARLRSASAGR